MDLRLETPTHGDPAITELSQLLQVQDDRQSSIVMLYITAVAFIQCSTLYDALHYSLTLTLTLTLTLIGLYTMLYTIRCSALYDALHYSLQHSLVAPSTAITITGSSSSS